MCCNSFSAVSFHPLNMYAAYRPPQPGRFSHLVPQHLTRSCVSREPEKQYVDKKQKYRTAAAPQPEMLLKAEPPLVQSPHHHSILFHLHSALKTNLFSLIIYHYSIYMHYVLKVFGKNWPEKAWKFLCASDLRKKILQYCILRKLLFACKCYHCSCCRFIRVALWKCCPG